MSRRPRLVLLAELDDNLTEFAHLFGELESGRRLDTVGALREVAWITRRHREISSGAEGWQSVSVDAAEFFARKSDLLRHIAGDAPGPAPELVELVEVAENARAQRASMLSLPELRELLDRLRGAR